MVSWSTGDTQHVDATTVYYRATDSIDWDETSATGTERSVTSLQPGTEYEFYVEIDSYGKTSTSERITATTGVMRCYLMFLVLLS